MIGDLTPGQIDQVLHRNILGRLGLVVDNKPYIVPLAFAFDGHHIYAHSRMGTKITAMRKNNAVCFQVDEIDRLDAWRSVMLQGSFEELGDARSIEMASQLLADRLNPLPISGSVKQPAASHRPPEVVEKKQRAIYFRIIIDSKSGKYEKPSDAG